MAAFMLATLISTIFALPAVALPMELDVVTTSSVPAVLPNGTFSYTVTITNNSGVDATNVVFTDTLTNGTMTSANPPVGTICTAIAGNVASTCTTASLLDGDAVTVTFNVTAPAGIGTVTNTVSAVDDDQGDLVSAGSDLDATTIVQDANLQVTKTHAPAVVNPGGAFTYTIAILNNGPSAATSVDLVDSAPAGVTFGTVSILASDAVVYTCAAATATTLPCGPWNIAVNTTVTITVNATLATSATGSISNTATATGAELDSVPANNASTDVLTPASTDLGVAISVDPTTAAPGDVVTYSVTVTNPSTTTDATNVVVTDALPAGLTAVTPPTDPPAGSGTVAVASNTWTWTIPTVVKATAPATSTVVTATFTATVDPTTTLTSITNTVTMTSSSGDPVSTNNTASVDLAISAEIADLNVLTAVDDSKPDQGDTIQIAIQVSNAGPAEATNIVLKDVLPTGLKYLSCEPTPCEQSGLRRQSSQLFSMPLVSANSAGTIILQVVVQASEGTLQNTASVVSLDQSDPTPANNQDSLNITIGGTAGNPGGGTGGTGGSGGTSGGTGGTTAFTGFTAGQLMPWFMLLFSLGLVAIEWARRMRLVAPIGSTYGFEPPF